MAEIETDCLPVVVIIDSSEDGRREKMAAAFAGVARVQLAYNTGLEIIFTDTANALLTELDPALVTLRHFRDLLTAPSNATTVTVYFGGNGGNDAAAPRDARFRIWRPISAGSGCLESSEARELVEFAQKIESGEADAQRPDFLKNPQTVFMLPTLSVLCQGYLAAHALPEEAQGIRHALEHAGLPAFLEGEGDDVAALKRVLPLKRGVTSSRRWWLDVLKEDCRQEVEEQIVSEMGVPLDESPAVKALVAAVYGAGKIQPSVVANAYCAIAAKLSGKPCTQG